MSLDKSCADCAYFRQSLTEPPCVHCFGSASAPGFCPGVLSASSEREEPVRARLLRQGIALTCGDRNAAYGDPAINMACAGELKAVIRKYASLAGRAIPPDEDEAVGQVATKLARYATGKVREDTFVDGATYFAITGRRAA